MSIAGLKEILEEYDDKCELYDSFTKKMYSLLTEILDINNMIVHSVTYRVKERDKLDKKIRKNQGKYQCLDDITDISGLRIITYFSDDVDVVAEILRREFFIDQENSVDRREIMESDIFGYLSLHYVVGLNEERGRLTEYQPYQGCKCEIQIRSILQHAWAEIEHDLGYKTEIEIPWEIRRKFTRIAGLLEVADTEFVQIKDSLSLYEATISDKISEVPEEVYIDKVSLASFINENNLVKRLNHEISTRSNSKYDEDLPINFSYIISELKYFNIVTISELEKKLSDNEEKIVSFAVDWLSEEDESFDIDVDLDEAIDSDDISEGESMIGPEISIFYIKYILIGEKQSLEYATNSLFSMWSELRQNVDSDEVEKLSLKIIETYKKLDE